MPRYAYLIIAIGVIVILAAIFVLSFILYVKTPVPEGCENLGRDESHCAECSESSCRFYARAMKRAQEKKQEDNHEKEGDK